MVPESQVKEPASSPKPDQQPKQVEQKNQQKPQDQKQGKPEEKKVPEAIKKSANAQAQVRVVDPFEKSADILMGEKPNTICTACSEESQAQKEGVEFTVKMGKEYLDIPALDNENDIEPIREQIIQQRTEDPYFDYGSGPHPYDI